MEYSFKITGQIPSGKNAVVITRTGKRFPQARFVKWRTAALKELNWKGPPISKPVYVFVYYFAGDKRRRDVPGMIDALWHLLEKAGVVSDDKYLGGLGKCTQFHQDYDKENPRVYIRLGVDEDEQDQERKKVN